jgi:thiamine biosynthesis lipoprotein
MNRRDFLHPRRLARSAGQVAGVLSATAPPPVPEADVALLRLSRRAMATTFELALPFATPNAWDMGEVVFDLLDALEAQMTVYRDTSEVANINCTAPVAPVVVEPRLFELLETAARITAETDGAFDVTAGALVKAWGFFKGPRGVPSETERATALERVGMKWVELVAKRRSVRFLRPGLEINLGSIGKGYALDRMAEALRDGWKITTALLHGGHSSVYAMGSPAGDGRGWSVGVTHPWQPHRRLAVLRLRDRALGTSAATFRHLEYNGRKLGHILDPRTGWSAEAMASASVLAPTAAEADALATAFFILGIEKTLAYCEKHPEIGAVLLANAPAAAPVFVNLPTAACG